MEIGKTRAMLLDAIAARDAKPDSHVVIVAANEKHAAQLRRQLGSEDGIRVVPMTAGPQTIYGFRGRYFIDHYASQYLTVEWLDTLKVMMDE